MTKRKTSTPKTAGLQRLTELVRAGKVRAPMPWASLRSEFPAQTDEASQRKFAEWARKNGFEWNLQPEKVPIGRSRQQVRVVVLVPGAKLPARRRLR
jgi:hypothetical protein